MCAIRNPDSAAQRDIRSTAERSMLYALFTMGSEMFEHPTTRDTFRLAEAAAMAVAGCSVVATYTSRNDRLRRFSGEPDRRLDLLVKAAASRDGEVGDGADWLYALFLWGRGKVTGCIVLRAEEEPSGKTQFLLHALAQPAGAALFTAELIERERRQSRALRKLSAIQADSNRAMAATITRQSARQRIRDAITVAAGSGGAETAVEALSGVLHRSVVLQDTFGRQRAYCGIRDRAAPAGPLTLEKSEDERVAERPWRSYDVSSAGETLGIIGVYDPEWTMGEEERFALQFASASIAVELAHSRRIAEVELRLGRDLADDLVSGVEAGGSAARAEALHYDLGRTQRVVLVCWELPPASVPVDLALAHELEAMRVSALVSRRPDAAMAVVADPCDTAELHRRLSITLGSSHGAIGVGGRSAVDGLPGSLGEARRALRIRVESRSPHGVSRHDDLGLLRILDTGDGGAEVERFVQEWLGALLDNDRAHHSDLVHTLAVYLDEGGNYDRTADGLIIHRSTLRYRLGRIRELCARDLSDPEVRLNLHVATRAWIATRGVAY